MNDQNWDYLPQPFPPFEAGDRKPTPSAPSSPFARLSAGRTLGKKVALLNDGTTFLNSSINALEIAGADSDAQNLQVTMLPPRVIPVGGTGQLTLAQARDVVQKQQTSGSYDNQAENLMGVQKFIWLPLIARVTWGVGGVSETAEVDFSNGLNLNLTASFLRISVAFDPYFVLVGHGDPSDFAPAIYELSSFVGPGYAKPRNSQRSIPMPGLSAIGGGAGPDQTSPIVPIPKYATSMMVSAISDANGYPASGWSVQALLFNSPGDGPPFDLNPDLAVVQPFRISSQLVTDNSNGTVEIPIPNNAKYFCLVNRSAFDVVPQVVFNLGF